MPMALLPIPYTYFKKCDSVLQKWDRTMQWPQVNENNEAKSATVTNKKVKHSKITKTEEIWWVKFLWAY